MNNIEMYVIVQINDFRIQIMANKYVNNQIQVLYKENIEGEQFAEKGVILKPEMVGKIIKNQIELINSSLNIKIQRISLSLPSHNLKIYQSQATLIFQDAFHRITNQDINKIIEMSKNINITTEEVMCLTKPFKFQVDNKIYKNTSPIDTKGEKLIIDNLIYSLPKELYNSQIAVLEFAQVEILSITLDQFALSFNFNNINNNFILIDWGENNTKIGLFSNSSLCAHETINQGFNQIITLLTNHIKCTNIKANNYLTRVINLNSNYLGDLIIDKYFDQKENCYVNVSKNLLQIIVKNQIDKIIEWTINFIENTLPKDNVIDIIFTGKTTTIPGFTEYLKKFYRLEKAQLIPINTVQGSGSYEWLTLIGFTHYQHFVNLFNQTFLSSIGKVIFNPKEEKNQTKIKENFNSQINSNYQYNGNR